jgi:hypothetical protein
MVVYTHSTSLKMPLTRSLFVPYSITIRKLNKHSDLDMREQARVQNVQMLPRFECCKLNDGMKKTGHWKGVGLWRSGVGYCLAEGIRRHVDVDVGDLGRVS